jgi:hypothetical protein
MLVLLLSALTASAQVAKREPRIGYVYPAGGQQGKTVRVLVGGQFLGGANLVHVSGEGVQVKILKVMRPIRNLDKDELHELHMRLIEVRDKRLAELPEAVRKQYLPQWRFGEGITPPANTNLAEKIAAAEKAAAMPENPPTMEKMMMSGEKPSNLAQKLTFFEVEAAKKEKEKEKLNKPDIMEHPLLYDLENKSLRELSHIVSVLTIPRDMLQQNRQIAESVLLDVTIDSNAAPGNREMRLRTNMGLTNPMVFQVGTIPEICELEPNDPVNYWKRPNMAILKKLLPVPPLELPVVLNGQILPGDIDHFRFRARQGQQLVIATQARSLVPYLADAVPGWFQPLLTLSDADGKPLATASSFQFDPDPVIFYKVPADGEYDIEIRDSLYRGRDDFVYRISVGELPFVTGINPLGGRSGEESVTTLNGWNLPENRLSLDTRSGVGFRQTIWSGGTNFSNRIHYTVDAFPEIGEIEPNDGRPEVQSVKLPVIVNGCLSRPGDVDVYQFEGHAGEEIVAEVMARRLYSPVDSLLRLIGPKGNVVAWNDDSEDKESGILTHSADSYLRTKLTEDGAYRVQLTDSQRHGGPEYCYRLRISPPRPDFVLRATPSSVNLFPGGSMAIRVYALRKDGFAGDIDLSLKDVPEGLTLSGGRIPAGRDSVRVTLSTARLIKDPVIPLKMEGRARIGDETVVRPVVPAEDMMQAFIYRHLVPSQEFLACVMNLPRNLAFIRLANNGPVEIPAGGAATVKVLLPNIPMLKDLQLELDEPPPGVTLQESATDTEGITLRLKADGEKVKDGYADNLIVEIILNREGKDAGPDGKKPKQRISLGMLPAIPFKVIQPVQAAKATP